MVYIITNKSELSYNVVVTQIDSRQEIWMNVGVAFRLCRQHLLVLVGNSWHTPTLNALVNWGFGHGIRQSTKNNNDTQNHRSCASSRIIPQLITKNLKNWKRIESQQKKSIISFSRDYIQNTLQFTAAMNQDEGGILPTSSYLWQIVHRGKQKSIQEDSKNCRLWVHSKQGWADLNQVI